MANQGCGADATWYQNIVGGFHYREVKMTADCGDTQTDVHGTTRVRFCSPCIREYKAEYPQGWETYPGDTCVHNVYVGGSGPDLLCDICEGWG